MEASHEHIVDRFTSGQAFLSQDCIWVSCGKCRITSGCPVENAPKLLQFNERTCLLEEHLSFTGSLERETQIFKNSGIVKNISTPSTG